MSNIHGEVGLDEIFNNKRIEEDGGYFSDMEKSPEESIGTVIDNAVTEEYSTVNGLNLVEDLVEGVSDGAQSNVQSTQEEIDYRAKYEAEHQSYEELRSLNGKQSTELGSLRDDYSQATAALEAAFDVDDSGNTVIRKEVLERLSGNGEMTESWDNPNSENSFNQKIENDDFRGAVSELAEQIAAKKVAESMSDINEIKEWRAQQIEDQKWSEVEQTLSNQIAELSKNDNFVTNREGVLEVLNSNPELYEHVENPVAMAWNIFKGREGLGAQKSAPKASQFAGETGGSKSPQQTDPYADFKAELIGNDGNDILKSLGI